MTKEPAESSELAPELVKKIREASVSGKIPCAVARAIAEELGIAYSEVGRAANSLGIKIMSCELGCF